jgi:hypothetical protein
MMVCRHMPRPALYHLFDPDRFDADVDKQREYRQRFIPSGLAHEIYLDTWLRMASFEPGVPYPKRLFDAYAAEVKRVDTNGDGYGQRGCDRRPGRTARLRQLCRAARRAPHGPASVGSLTMAWLVFCYPVARRPHGAYNHHHQETA